MTPPRVDPIDLRTQELVKLQIGELVLSNAHQKATLEAVRAELAALKTPPEPPHDPQ